MAFYICTDSATALQLKRAKCEERRKKFSAIVAALPERRNRSKPSHNVILSEAKNLGLNLDRSVNANRQRCFAKPVLSKIGGLNMTVRLITETPSTVTDR